MPTPALQKLLRPAERRLQFDRKTARTEVDQGGVVQSEP